jgi:hypothetical protein
MILAWHFTRDMTQVGPPVPVPGQVIKYYEPLESLLSVPSASDRIIDALTAAPGHLLHRVRLGGKILRHGTRLVSSEWTFLWSIDAREILLDCARRWALDVLHLWTLPAMVKEYLETGREELRDAAIAASLSVSAAASAAWSAAFIAYTKGYHDTSFKARDADIVASKAAEAAAKAAIHSARVAAIDAGLDAGSLDDPDGAKAFAAIRAKQNDYITDLVMKAHEEAKNV